MYYQFYISQIQYQLWWSITPNYICVFSQGDIFSGLNDGILSRAEALADIGKHQGSHSVHSQMTTQLKHDVMYHHSMSGPPQRPLQVSHTHTHTQIERTERDKRANASGAAPFHPPSSANHPNTCDIFISTLFGQRLSYCAQVVLFVCLPLNCVWQMRFGFHYTASREQHASDLTRLPTQTTHTQRALALIICLAYYHFEVYAHIRPSCTHTHSHWERAYTFPIAWKPETCWAAKRASAAPHTRRTIIELVAQHARHVTNFHPLFGRRRRGNKSPSHTHNGENLYVCRVCVCMSFFSRSIIPIPLERP